MKTYREYYALAIKQENDWYYSQKDARWRRDENTRRSFDVKGEYIETVNKISVDDKNDTPIFTNHTNLKNSELTRLHYILVQALIDWLNENKKADLYNFTLKLFRRIDYPDNVYEIEYSAQRMVNEYPNDDVNNWIGLIDVNDPELQECADFLCDLTTEFIESHSNDISLDWNALSFYIDTLELSCKYNKWSSCSDSYLNIGNLDFEDKYTAYVLSM